MFLSGNERVFENGGDREEEKKSISCVQSYQIQDPDKAFLPPGSSCTYQLMSAEVEAAHGGGRGYSSHTGHPALTPEHVLSSKVSFVFETFRDNAKYRPRATQQHARRPQPYRPKCPAVNTAWREERWRREEVKEGQDSGNHIATEPTL